MKIFKIIILLFIFIILTIYIIGTILALFQHIKEQFKKTIMTPKEKAKDLYDSYWYCLLQSNIEKRNYWSQQCALIAIEEVIDNIEDDFLENDLKYWQEVKNEIEKL